MRNSGLHVIGMSPLTFVIIGLSMSSWAASTFVATPESPAVIAIKAMPADVMSARVSVRILSFKRPETGGVTLVANLEARGETKEIGRHIRFPGVDFKADKETDAYGLVFSVPPSDLAKYIGAPVNLRIELVPLGGDGTGARLEIGSVKFERPR